MPDILQRKEVVTLADGVLATHLEDVSLGHKVYVELSRTTALDDIAHSVVDNELQYRPEEWWVKINCQYKLIIPGQGKPLLSGSKQSALRFQFGADIESGRLKV